MKNPSQWDLEWGIRKSCGGLKNQPHQFGGDFEKPPELYCTVTACNFINKGKKFLTLCRPDGNCQTSEQRSPVNKGQNCPFPQLVFVHRFDCTLTFDNSTLCKHKARLCFRCYVILFVLRFYGPVNPLGSCRARSVYLTTHLLGRLSPLSG